MASIASAMASAMVSMFAAQQAAQPIPAPLTLAQPLSASLASQLVTLQPLLTTALPDTGGPSRHPPIPAYVPAPSAGVTYAAAAASSEISLLGERLKQLCLAKGYKPPPGGFVSSMASYDSNTSYILSQQFNIVDEVQRLSERRETVTEQELAIQRTEEQHAIDSLEELRANHRSFNLLTELEYDDLQQKASNDRDKECRAALAGIPDKPAWLVEQHVPTVVKGVLDEISSLGYFLTSYLQV